ncbi:MAG TPA: PilZ domain-containing protein [Burkholderiales bacterium]|nr:PilZ domain-containing protein [Burkholderiales bacterium]
MSMNINQKEMTAFTTVSTQSTGNADGNHQSERPGVISLRIKEKEALYSAWMPFVIGGGLFIPTTRGYQLHDEIFMLLHLLDDPNPVKVDGRVVWVTPAQAPGHKKQGIGVQFSTNENGSAAKRRIEGLLAGIGQNVRITHTM